LLVETLTRHGYLFFRGRRCSLALEKLIEIESPVV